MELRWFVHKTWGAAPGSWARDWPSNAVIHENPVLQYRDGDKWKDVPTVQGKTPERPTR